jgi:iron complex outermembrane recepter protein
MKTSSRITQWTPRFSALAVAMGLASASMGQDAQIEEITVTGSLIRNITGMTTPTPVTAVTNTELAALSPTTMISALSQLPQFLGNTNNDVRTGFFSSPGSGNLNLRGLNTGGSGRTLTLLDGRRVVPANGLGSVDINILPSALVRRVDTVTGGASAAYGTDAVAGAVNFILDTKYTGWTASAQLGSTAESDRDNMLYSAAFGTPIGDRLHLLVSGEYYEADMIKNFQSRDWFNGYALINNPAPAPAPRLIRRPNVVSSIATYGGLINSGVPTTSALFRQHFQPNGTLAPFVLGEGTATSAHSITNGGSGDNTSGELLTLAPDAERYSGFVYLSFDATPNLNLYAQGLLGQSMTDQDDHGGRFANVAGLDTRITIFRDNAFLPDAVRQIMINENLNSFQMNVVGDRDGLGRTSRLRQDNETTSGTLGFKWDLTQGFLDGWQVNGYVQSGKADNRGYQEGILLHHMMAAVDAVRDANNNIVCHAATINPAKWGDCVPINLFGRGNASDAAIAYVTNFKTGQQINSSLFFQPDEFGSGKSISYTSGPGKVYNTETRQKVADLSMNGKVWDGWAGPVMAALGVSYRKEEIEQIVWDPSNPSSNPSIFPASAAQSPELRGVPSNIATRSSMVQNSTVANVHGYYHVKEAFTELQVPLLQGVRMAESLNLLAAARVAEYTGSGEVWSWKTGLDWQVYSDLRLRATVSQDVRAATLLERFNQTGGIGTVNLDPMFPNDGQQAVSTRTGGNPSLDPETSKTYTYGFVYQPSWLEGFSASVDYWDVDIAGAIGTLGIQRIVDDCFSGAGNVCGLITRDPVTNRVQQVRNITQNIAAAAGRGIDMELSYRRPITLFRGADENLGARVFWSHMKENSSMTDRSRPATYFDSAGQTGIGNLPEDAVTGILTYNRNALNLALTARYISSGIYNKRFNLPTAARPDVEDNTVPSVTYVNLSGSYSWELSNGTLELMANVQNLFDKNPPLVANQFDATLGQVGTQVNQGLFDLLGRRFTVGVTFRH